MVEVFFPISYFTSIYCTNRYINYSSNINPFLVNVLILYPLKTPEKQRCSGAFRGYKMGILARNGLRNY